MRSEKTRVVVVWRDAALQGYLQRMLERCGELEVCSPLRRWRRCDAGGGRRADAAGGGMFASDGGLWGGGRGGGSAGD